MHCRSNNYTINIFDQRTEKKNFETKHEHNIAMATLCLTLVPDPDSVSVHVRQTRLTVTSCHVTHVKVT